jgi:hypothetical protein
MYGPPAMNRFRSKAASTVNAKGYGTKVIASLESLIMMKVLGKSSFFYVTFPYV